MLTVKLKCCKPKIRKQRHYHLEDLQNPQTAEQFKEQIKKHIPEFESSKTVGELYAKFTKAIIEAQETCCRPYNTTGGVTKHVQSVHWNQKLQELLVAKRRANNQIMKLKKRTGKRRKQKELEQLQAKWKHLHKQLQRELKQSRKQNKPAYTTPDIDSDQYVNKKMWKILQKKTKGDTNGAIYQQQIFKETWETTWKQPDTKENKEEKKKLDTWLEKNVVTEYDDPISRQQNKTWRKGHDKLDLGKLMPNSNWGTGISNSETALFRIIEPAEIKNCRIHLLNGKSPGLDGITNEALKHLPDELDNILATLFNRCIREETSLPEQMTIGAIHFTPKHHKDQTQPGNWRPIALLSCLRKLLEKLLTARLSDWIEEKEILGEYQAGFRRGRNCSQQAFILKTLIQHAKRKGKHLICTFLDVTKAFDSISHATLLNKCIKIGLPAPFVQCIKLLLTDLRFYIKNFGPPSNDRNSVCHPFPIERGCPQGGIISPLLYLIYVADLSNNTDIQLLGPKLYYTKVGIIMFADDTALNAMGKTFKEAHSKAQAQLKICENWANENQILFNIGKSYSMHFAPTAKSAPKKKPLLLYSKELPWTKKFTYLGIQITTNTSTKRQAPNDRINAAKENYDNIKVNLLARNITGVTSRAARDLYTMTIVSSMLYGCEITDIEGGNLNTAQDIHKDAARTILGVPYTSIAVWLTYEELGWLRIQSKINQRILNFIGNIFLSHAKLPKEALQYCFENHTDYGNHVECLIDHYDLDKAYTKLQENGKKLSKEPNTKHREEYKKVWEKTVHKAITKKEYEWWSKENNSSERGITIPDNNFGEIGKAQPYIRSNSANASYGFIWRRGFIGPRCKPKADCYFCHKAAKDTPHHLLHECQAPTCKKYQEKILASLPDPKLYNSIELLLGTNDQNLSLPNDNLTTIMDLFFELYRTRCRLRDPHSEGDEYVAY
jgi:hypothetical protein